MNLKINNSIYVSDIAASDKGSYLKYFNNEEVNKNLLRPPFPYTESDADWWLEHVATETARLGQSVSWGIRLASGELIGGVGFLDLIPGVSHRAEIGYWLAQDFWGRGWMTEVVRAVCDWALTQWRLSRITANVFHYNERSAAVLRKAGFQFEGLMRNHYEKNGKIFDGLLFARVFPSIESAASSYAVIFSSRLASDEGYEAMAEKMVSLAREQPGFLGIESARGVDRFGITVSYWESLAAIRAWREHVDHRAAQERGRKDWYSQYHVRIARVEREYGKK